jgi:hypothetical protein
MSWMENALVSCVTTARGRVEAALRHEQPDRTPIFEYLLLNPIAEQVLERRYVDYAGDWQGWLRMSREVGWEKSIRQYVVDRLVISERLGHDMLCVAPNPLQDSSDAADCLARSVTDDPVERVRIRTQATLESFSGVPDDSLLVYRCLRDEMHRRGLDLPILGPAYWHGVWTDSDLMQTMLLEPEVAHQHFELATQIALAYIDAYVALGIDQVGVGGDFAGNRPLISPQSYREFIMPEVRKLSRRCHKAGLWAVNASDGNLWSVLDDFLAGCEADGYLEIDMGAGMDLAQMKQSYGGSVTFYGNMDCGNTLSFATVDEVRRCTVKCLESGFGDGGHIFCCSNAITASVPVCNYLAMVNAYRDMFGLPLLALSA